MNFFSKKTTWTNAEFIPFKLAIGSAYLIVGAWLHHYVHQFLIPIAAVFAVTVIWTVWKWLQKMGGK